MYFISYLCLLYKFEKIFPKKLDKLKIEGKLACMFDVLDCIIRYDFVFKPITGVLMWDYAQYRLIVGWPFACMYNEQI